MKLIDQSIDSALSGSNVVKAPVVSLKKVRRTGKNATTSNIVRRTEPPTVQESVVRIINECDPVGFLSDVVNGKAIEAHIVTEGGEVVTIYETPSLKQRIQAANFLAERFLPKVAVVKHAHLHKSADKPSHGDGRSFGQLVTHAAQKSSNSSE